jgi:hypothetical protein
MAMSPLWNVEQTMKPNSKFMFRMLMLAAGCIASAAAVVLLARGQLTPGFFLAFAGLSAVAVAETEVDAGTRFTAASLAASMRRDRSGISTLGSLCGITSWFCLAAALVSWVALR